MKTCCEPSAAAGFAAAVKPKARKLFPSVRLGKDGHPLCPVEHRAA